jgi:hypothetical protein
VHKLFLLIVVASQLVASCHSEDSQARKQTTVHPVGQPQSKLDYDDDKTSPYGTYRLRIEVRTGPKKGTRDYPELGRYQFYRGHELIYTYNWEESDQYEPTFRELMPNIEWVTDNILRMGRQNSDQPFFDQIILENKTDEILKYVSVGYGKTELFWLFDLKPADKTLLRARPQFKADGTSNYFIGYGGMTLSGKEFEGTAEVKQRESAVEGPLKFAITISGKDLR